MFSIIVTAVALSMDAFSLAIGYGMFKMRRNNIIILSLIVGLFHFFMPILGSFVGVSIFKSISWGANVVAGLIFLIISIQMFFSIYKSEDIKSLNGLFSMILFAFSVSIDSFSVGIGIKALSDNLFLCSIVFSIISSLFTFCGLSLGCYLNRKIGDYATIFGSLLLFCMSIYCLFLS